jgi:diaminohydroxyphosphoribosylaminopyrimidine deaminase / 5-amino-6-(5-phosphoribosylamino)uracil reductase
VTGSAQEQEAWERILDRRDRLRSSAPPSAAEPRDFRAVDGTETPLESIYLPLLRPGRIVMAQLGQTLDGRIATRTGHSHYVTGPEDIVHLHRLRALVDAVVVGAGTAISDDPQLTVREVSGDNPVRVVLDPSARVPLDRRMFRDGAAATLWIVAPHAPVQSAPPGIEVLRLPERSTGGGFDPCDVLQALTGRGLGRVLVEGGGVTVSRFLDAGVLDRLHLTIAPLLLGSGRPSLTLEPVDRLDQALRPHCRQFLLGEDVLFDLEFSR